MENSFSTLIKERYSCRSYRPDAPSREQIGSLIEAARLAPSACNRQPWRFVIVGPDDEAGRKAVIGSYSREWVASAPVFIVACSVPSEAWTRQYDGKNHSDIDVAIATEHICLQASALGLATCWICNFDPAALAEGLGLPEGIEPVVILPVGYPADNAPEKKRKDVGEIIIDRC